MGKKKTGPRAAPEARGRTKADRRRSGAAVAPSARAFSPSAVALAEALGENLYLSVVAAWDAAAGAVSPADLMDDIAESKFDEPLDLATVTEIASAFRIWPLATLEFWDALDEERISLVLIADRLAGESVTFYASDSEPSINALLGTCHDGDITSWPEDARHALATEFATEVGQETYGDPTDILIPDALAWLVSPLQQAVKRAFKAKRRTPNVWLASTAPPRQERARVGREAVARYRKEQDGRNAKAKAKPRKGGTRPR